VPTLAVEVRGTSPWKRGVAATVVIISNGLLASDRCPKAFVTEKAFEVLPPEHAKWQAEHEPHRPPTEYSPFCPAQGLTAKAVVVTSPRQGDVFLLDLGYEKSTQSVELGAEVDPALLKATWLLDGHDLAVVP
jgi:hypothetical protein